jgi:hypothetical protein
MSEAQVHTFGEPGGNDKGTDDEMNPDSIYQMLRKELSTPVENEPLVLKVPSRKNVSIRFSTAIEFDLLQKWLKASSKRGVTDQLLFAQQVISNQCEAVLFGDVEATDDEGTSLTFAHKELRDMLGARDVKDAIRKMYVKDGHIIGTSQRVAEAAGYSEEDMEEGGNPL